MNNRLAFQDSVPRMLHFIAAITYRVLKHSRLSFEARLIEYDFATSNITDARIGGTRRILDVGCGGSPLPIALGRKGHEVYGIDARPDTEDQPFSLVRGNIMQMPFDDSSFDVVTVISTIEHVGLGRYGDPTESGGDRRAIEEIRRVLKPGGAAVFTIPCGYCTIHYSADGTPLGRVYSGESLVKLLNGFQIVEMSYIVKRMRVWLPATLTAAEREVRLAKPEKVGTTAIALVLAHNTAKGGPHE